MVMWPSEVRIARDRAGTMPYRATLSTTEWIWGELNVRKTERERERERSESGGGLPKQGDAYGTWGMRVFRGLSRARRTHIVRFYTRSAVETLRSSDQIGSTERVRSIGSTATAQIHGRPRNIPWPQSRSAIHSALANRTPCIFSPCAEMQIVAPLRSEILHNFISTCANLDFTTREEERISSYPTVSWEIWIVPGILRLCESVSARIIFRKKTPLRMFRFTVHCWKFHVFRQSGIY